jgi:putative phosphoribosyl transferase
MRFHDRREGGRELAGLLVHHRDEDPIVLALPRGGVQTGYEVARALDAPLDVIVARKIGAPACPEFAIGAIAEGGALFVDPGAMAEAGVEREALAELVEAEALELARRVRIYRGDRPFPEVRGRTVLLVDDGIATGRTVRAAIRSLRQLGPRRLVLAAPVVAPDTAQALAVEVDELVRVHDPEPFIAVGLWYDRFEQTTDEEVVELLALARRAHAGSDEAREEGGAGPERDDPCGAALNGQS